MLRPKSLQQRLIFFLLVPLALLMLGVGAAAFSYATANIFNEWREAAVLKLARTAHAVDMSLGRTKRLVRMYHEAAVTPQSHEVRQWIIEQIKEMDGIEGVRLTGAEQSQSLERQAGDDRESRTLPHEPPVDSNGLGKESLESVERPHAHHEVLPTRYESASGHKKVTMISETRDENQQTIGTIEVVMLFDTIMESIEESGWHQADRAYLIDYDGRILSCTTRNHQKVSLDSSPLELATVKAARENRSGTILSGGLPPDEVSGFYRLREAPWVLVIVAPGGEILAPVIRFGLFFLIMGAGSIALILVLIRTITAPSVSMILEVSRTADRVARGEYGNLPAAKTKDEVGRLVTSFNSMVLQLQERMKLKEAMHVAMEVQQGLLPRSAPRVDGLDLAGTSIYCEETGGDYYDFFQLPEIGRNATGIAVGDVVGHGIGAALLMTTVRAFLHSKASEPGGLSRMISEVNRLLCRDTQETSSFVTLFFMVVDPDARRIGWVRAGHDPALVYAPSTDTFEELRGEGIALGIDEEYIYHEYTCTDWTAGQIVIIGTDGIWDTENTDGGTFGKDLFKEIIRKHSHLSASEILQATIDALASFRQTCSQGDDTTMVIAKIL